MPIDLIGSISAWIIASPYVDAASQLNGGWEKWATTDISLFLLAQRYDVTPQSHSFTNGESSDIEVIDSGPNGGPLDPRTHTDIIEMKCSGWPVGDDLGRFMLGIQDDVRKLCVNRLDAAITTAASKKWAIGIIRRRDDETFIDTETRLKAVYKTYPTVEFQHPTGTTHRYSLQKLPAGNLLILWCNPGQL